MVDLYLLPIAFVLCDFAVDLLGKIKGQFVYRLLVPQLLRY